MNKKLMLLLMIICNVIFSFSIINITYAKPNTQQNTSIIKRNVTSSPLNEKMASYFTKRTTLTENNIYDMLKLNFSKEDIKTCYIISLLSNEKFNKILDIYQDENKKVGLTLKDLSITYLNYINKYTKIFPNEDETDFDFITQHKPSQKINLGN